MKHRKSRSAALIVQDLKEKIIRGDYLCGEFLPPVRELAQLYSAANQTISAAFDELTALGLVSRTGRGCQVLSDADSPQRRPLLVLYQQPILEHYSLFAVLAGITARLDELRLNYRVVDSRRRLPSPEEIADRHSGVVMAMALNQAGRGFVEELDRRRIPNAIANLEADWPFTATRVNRAETTAQAVRILYDMGHRDVALLGRDPGLYFYGQSLNGYRTQLERLGLPFRKELVLITPELDLFATFRTVRTALRSGPRFTGLVAGRDSLAHAAVEACRECGLEVGRDISVIGFDDLSWPQRERTLTTFEEPCRQLGAAAVDLVYEELLTGWHEPVQKFLTAELRLRRTLAPCREKNDSEHDRR